MELFENNKNWDNCDTLLKGLKLDLASDKLISFVGAGGKTTSIFQLAEELSALSYKVIITTTTHMYIPTEHFCTWNNKDELVNRLEKESVLVVGIPVSNGKFIGMEDSAYSYLKTIADFIIVEADGAKHMLVKVPACHEPVLPKDTDLVVGVLSYKSIGHRIKEVGHRPADVAAFLETTVEHTITWKDLIKIGYSKEGLMKNVNVPFRLLICNEKRYLTFKG